jgi:16S rRNA (guanine(966)-N(2))-methyltransferase RsmD
VRIISGRFRGRRLKAPAGSGVRPTSDSLRETLFNVLGPTLDGACVLDAFAGTGALGLEAISRGASQATFVERDAVALRVLRENIDACGVADACVIIRGNFPSALDRRSEARFDLILLDPPYEIEDLPAVVAGAATFVAPQGRVVLEHSRRRRSPEAAGALRRTRVLTAGDSALSFYAPESPATQLD